ncbi:hypothetical protein EJ04DRAFT_22517 [Polyplosphaeria fusca]|uniref:Uncharacterized protein n=1 Tax=Polyplosphaeria fusca TaxID=682080 RepID=A0A9P4R8J7_9PLEO|nr:hypothetical protein EJ04DRAFT_22517 [Polyplosphaeria fusca]
MTNAGSSSSTRFLSVDCRSLRNPVPDVDLGSCTGTDSHTPLVLYSPCSQPCAIAFSTQRPGLVLPSPSRISLALDYYGSLPPRGNAMVSHVHSRPSMRHALGLIYRDEISWMRLLAG